MKKIFLLVLLMGVALCQAVAQQDLSLIHI